jgi:hypothetical protein
MEIPPSAEFLSYLFCFGFAFLVLRERGEEEEERRRVYYWIHRADIPPFLFLLGFFLAMCISSLFRLIFISHRQTRRERQTFI